MSAAGDPPTAPVGARPASPPPAPVVVEMGGPVRPEDLGAMCAGVRAALMGTDASADLVCDLGALAPVDLAAVDALARLSLLARRRGRRLRLQRPPAELCELLALTGLSAVLGLEGEGQPELREQGADIEEGVEGDDPPL